MLSFAPPLPVPTSPCAARTSHRPSAAARVRMAALERPARPTRARAIASFATTVGAVLTLFTTSAHALSTPLSPSPPVATPTNTTASTSNAHSHNMPLVNVSAAHRAATTQHAPTRVSTGEKVAAVLRARGLPDELVVLIISSLPVVELRGGIPVGFLLGVPPLQIFLLSVIGNMLPVLPLMWLLRLSLVQRVASKVLDRARRKARSVGTSSSQPRALALFVGVPLPGTGAWTGCLVAFVLGMRPQTTFFSLLLGVISAAVIVTSLCLLGKTGGAIAASLLLGTGLVSLLNSFKPAPVPSDHTPSEDAVLSQTSD